MNVGGKSGNRGSKRNAGVNGTHHILNEQLAKIINERKQQEEERMRKFY